jgi:hypothetical protein
MTRDNNYSPFLGRHSRPTEPVLVQRLWRAQKPANGTVLACAMFLHPLGFEVRCWAGNEDNLLMSQAERIPQAAKAHADEWLATAVSRGFEEIP